MKWKVFRKLFEWKIAQIKFFYNKSVDDIINNGGKITVSIQSSSWEQGDSLFGCISQQLYVTFYTITMKANKL